VAAQSQKDRTWFESHSGYGRRLTFIYFCVSGGPTMDQSKDSYHISAYKGKVVPVPD
jgi:hypothetical protein